MTHTRKDVQAMKDKGKDKNKDNIRDFKVHKGKAKAEKPPQFLPRFIREVRTPHSERYSLILNDDEHDFPSLGTLDLHINETVQATLVIVPEIDEIAVKYLQVLIQTELIDSLELEIESFNVFVGVSNCLSFDEDDDDDCNGDCDHCLGCEDKEDDDDDPF
jgi:hypothetical protein